MPRYAVHLRVGSGSAAAADGGEEDSDGGGGDARLEDRDAADDDDARHAGSQSIRILALDEVDCK